MRSLLLFLVSIGSLVFLREIGANTCNSIDIRNNVTEFEKLRNCTIIAGSLQVVLFENVKESDFENISFPHLVEITDFLLFYRVRGLKSLGKLFPNLSIIRGLDLLKDYALVIYDMSHLQEIGLSSLSAINRGSVRIEKNPSLCYVDTVNWKKLLIDKKFHPITVTSPNHSRSKCPNCPESCPALEGSKWRNCWNNEFCQKAISSKCHPECVKGCDGPRNNQCYVCKNYKDGDRCVSNCSSNKYLLAPEATCITQEECLEKQRWIFRGECVNSCSAGYKPYKNPDGSSFCKYCGADCPVECGPILIEDMTSAQIVKGCTHVNGSLVIRINGPKDIEDELEKYLGSIEEINGYLKVHRSSLRSLNFLKRLRVINGNPLENRRYAFIVHDNEYLQNLWDWDNFTLQIKNGTFNFHYNPELCMSEIDKLKELSSMGKSFKDNITNVDISPHSNGYKFACNQINITTEIELVAPNTINLKWKTSSVPDQQSLIGYLIYYIEAENKSITTFDEDACGDLGWRTIFVSNRNDTNQLNQTIFYLEPFTKYAYYISTAYSTGNGGQSSLSYFKTLSSDPSNPLTVEAIAAESDSLLVTWKKPAKLNGILSHYEIFAYMIEDEKSYIDLRNYCNFPLQKHKPKVPKIVPNKESTTLAPNRNSSNNCNCQTEEKISVIYNDFDTICSTLDVYGEEFNKYSCADFSYQVIPSENHVKYSERSSSNNMIIRKRSKPPKPLIFKVMSNETSYKITGLRHFSIYVLLLRACNTKNTSTNETERAQCSSVVQLSQRTARKPNADNLQTPRLYVGSDKVDVKWPEPSDPNGVIVTYHIEYRRVDKENHKLIDDCITRSQHQRSFYQYLLHGMTPGNYSIRIKAQSLAGDGNYTDVVYFYIPMPGNSATIIYIIVIIILFAVLAGIIGVYFWYKKRRQLDSVHLITTCNPDYVGYQEEEWEMDRDNVKLLQELGQGTFGTVYQGLIKDRQIPCAIKTVNEKADLHDKMEFLNEASVMKSFNEAHHVIRLLGVVSRGVQPLVVMELMARGDLKTFLRSTRDGSTCLTCSEMYRMAAEIADGMAYLSAKKFVHRDLAARNCMVSSDRTVKIGDFGMTRDIYETDYYRKETRGLLPVRWMSPESLADGVFTTESDIWSYGIVLWEIATLAEQPYQGLANEQVLQFVIAKGTLDRPQQCPDLLYEIMDACWKWRPFQRPTFADIVEKLETHVGQDFKLVSFYHSKEGEEFRLVKRELNKLNTQLPYQSNVGALANYNNRNVAALWTKDANDCSFYVSGSPSNSVGPSNSYQSPNGFRAYPNSSSS